MNTHTTKQTLLDALYAPYKNSHILLVQGGSHRIIFGEGDIDAKLMLIGEAPGAEEDESGIFVSGPPARAGIPDWA